MKTIIETAYQAAKQVREHAYAPYSGFKVGAALVAKESGTIYTGCNIENASYGATICAERNAVFHAIAKDGRQEYEAIVIVTESCPPAPPCALCLQVLVEFCDPSLKVYLGTLDGIEEEYELSELLPHPFDGSSLRTEV